MYIHMGFVLLSSKLQLDTLIFPELVKRVPKFCENKHPSITLSIPSTRILRACLMNLLCLMMIEVV